MQGLAGIPRRPRDSQIEQIPLNRAHPEVQGFVSPSLHGWAPFLGPHLAYIQGSLACQELKNTPIGS